MKCPRCEKTLYHVNLVGTSWQKAYINKKGSVTDYGDIEEIEVSIIECPECAFVLQDIINFDEPNPEDEHEDEVTGEY